MADHIQTGIAATFSLEDYENNIILKHENTRRVKEEDRTNHILNVKAQTGPVFLTCESSDVISKIINLVTADKEAEYDFKSEDGIRHSLWILTGGIQ